MLTLICGNHFEEPVALLIAALKKKQSDFLMLSQKDLAETVQMRWQLTDHGIEGSLKVGKEVLEINSIKSVYHRFVSAENTPGIEADCTRVAKIRSVMHSLMDLFDVLPGRVVNRRRAMMSNNSKPYQAMLIKRVGFSIPDTLITNNPETVLDYSRRCGPIIYKSASSVRSIVSTFDNGCFERIETLRYLPTQFQKKINGYNVRVHVIGRRVFATRIKTTATDYRYAARDGILAEFTPFGLNTDLRYKCLALARECGLDFAGIDLIVSEEGVYCLEVNPSPGYSYYQNATDQPIAEALADYLLYEC